MSDEFRSIVIGTGGLSVALLAALFLTVTRVPGASGVDGQKRVAHSAAVALACHVVHFSEELAHGFPERFPGLFGLRAWSVSFFVAFNLFWLVVWLISVVGLRIHLRMALFPIWFLALAAALNGVVHPLLAAAQRGYFPGLWTSPFVGLAGLLLLHRLFGFTSGRAGSPPTNGGILAGQEK
jgi:hypothetical protein